MMAEMRLLGSLEKNGSRWWTRMETERGGPILVLRPTQRWAKLWPLGALGRCFSAFLHWASRHTVPRAAVKSLAPVRFWAFLVRFAALPTPTAPDPGCGGVLFPNCGQSGCVAWCSAPQNLPPPCPTASSWQPFSLISRNFEVVVELVRALPAC